MTNLQRIMALAFIQQALPTQIFTNEQADSILSVTEKELDEIAETDEQLTERFTEMARELYAELTEETEGEDE